MAPPLRSGGGSDRCKVLGDTSSSASVWLWQLQHTWGQNTGNRARDGVEVVTHAATRGQNTPPPETPPAPLPEVAEPQGADATGWWAADDAPLLVLPSLASEEHEAVDARTIRFPTWRGRRKRRRRRLEEEEEEEETASSHPRSVSGCCLRSTRHSGCRLRSTGVGFFAGRHTSVASAMLGSTTNTCSYVSLRCLLCASGHYFYVPLYPAVTCSLQCAGRRLLMHPYSS